jgi:hypothetical protein
VALLPPTDVPPERLFRLLLGRPRPVLPIAFRFPWAPDVALAVRGLTALEDASAGDVDPDLPEAVRRSEVTRRLIASWLLADGRPALSPEDVGDIDEGEADALLGAILPAARIVSPQYRTADTEAWGEALKKGAKHPSNRALAGLVAFSAEVVAGFGVTAQISAPDRYFGIPYADLTDGQIMAYQAAKKLADETSK